MQRRTVSTTLLLAALVWLSDARADSTSPNPQERQMYSGFHHLRVDNPLGSRPFPAIVQYPTFTPPSGLQLGPYRFEATLDAPIAEGSLPVCVISHGGGGSHLLYRTIATHLARNGYIVVSLEHPGDNRNDTSLSNTDAAAAQRPLHASLAIDAVLTSPALRSSANGARVCAIGHSMGGYTILALLGGHPWSSTGQPIETKADHRIRAAVLLAPSTDWFLAPGAMSDVSAPLLVVTAELDEIRPTHRVAQALSKLPSSTSLVSREVRGAGHYSFLSPFPPEMRRKDFPPSTDPEGFDRDRFHVDLPEMILEYLSQAMPIR